MTLVQEHAWSHSFIHQATPDAFLSIGLAVQLVWDTATTILTAAFYSSNPSLYDANETAEIRLGPCDSVSPWDTLTHTWTLPNGQAYGTVHAFRSLFLPYTMLPLLAHLSGLAGPIGSYTIHHAPKYPAGAIPGVTPPTHHVTIMRARAPRTYTDPGHIAANEAFTTAADQWKALDEEARQAWTAAGKTCKPPIPGYALWTQIIKTKRLDRIPTLQTRTGISLTPPTL
jgi:hypothetical protein